MVSVVHALSDAGIDGDILTRLGAGLSGQARTTLDEALDLAADLYAGKSLGTGEEVLRHAVGMALQIATLNLDLDARLAAVLFAAADYLPEARVKLVARFGESVADLVTSLHRLKGLRPLTEAAARTGGAGDAKAQAEILRKMLLAMAADIRVVMLRLASRAQTLRWLTDHDTPERHDLARESLEVYAPLANRLGVWQMKWEIEDLSFRFLEPLTYKRIAKQLDEKRVERESFIGSVVARLQAELERSGIGNAEVYGRPKHIFSIWNKMRQKDIDFAEVHDVRALRIVVDEVKDCYTALGLVHALWQPIHGEFDDYISHPKGNYYRSLHTAVLAEDGRSLEVQIRTQEMHRHAELGVAAHWRYKEAGSVGQSAAKAESAYDEKIAWLRQLLSWRDELTDSAAWVEQFKRAALDDTIYVLTPQGRIIDLPKGATPVDFAYRLHTDIGHRCRGAKVDGHLVPLNTPLANGQRVEIMAAKAGGPSRDWLAPEFLHSSRARQKVKAWFAAQQESEMLAQGRNLVARELQRAGQSLTNLDELAHKLGCKNPDQMFLAAARGELGPRAFQMALRGDAATAESEPELATRKSKTDGQGDGGRILVVGVDKLMTQLGRCCKPVPPDRVAGFVTRGRGVSVHRLDCANFRNMSVRNPERVVDAQWGGQHGGVYAADLLVEANDRQGLLRDISDVLSKEKINVTAVKTQSKSGLARMAFTVELADADQLQRVLARVGEIGGVIGVRRG
ncbi:MAG: bifunctional (p)ppGpp synthetase/guanosine-3',5'-bis(diphosphate) 3'-pyrophosphohydrolase [Rhodocyclaceae bacterium]|nr:bifunctional (p)ppGpp synthetase/guanosine-3',5'-bis(diphosphate) 3'-pyrophosphohydrolase [Rhodocyclaceae bacterium]